MSLAMGHPQLRGPPTLLSRHPSHLSWPPGAIPFQASPSILRGSQLSFPDRFLIFLRYFPGRFFSTACSSFCLWDGGCLSRRPLSWACWNSPFSAHLEQESVSLSLSLSLSPCSSLHPALLAERLCVASARVLGPRVQGQLSRVSDELRVPSDPGIISEADCQVHGQSGQALAVCVLLPASFTVRIFR